MAVININKEYLKNETNKEEKEIVDILNKLGFPTDVEEDFFIVEVTPNRPDMLGWRGVIRAINNYAGKKEQKYVIDETIGEIKVYGVPSRQYIGVAAVTEIKDRNHLIESLIELQEKLDQTLGRMRKKIAIGLHNLDKIKLPLSYKEVEDAVFVPLGEKKEMNIEGILSNTWQGKKYRNLVGTKYPMLYDSKGVISFPPIINSERTKIDKNTTNFLIDVTGTHKESITSVLNIILCELKDRGGKIKNIKGDNIEKLKYVKMGFDKKNIERLLGFEFDENKLLSKMGLKKQREEIVIPPYRNDFMEIADIAEDIAIA